MTNQEAINVLNTIYENPTASEQIKEACIVAMEAVDIKNSVERITTGLQVSSEETCEIEKLKGTMTNAEAIKSIQDTLNDYLAEKCFESKDDVSRVCEPFDLAINALEREETCENIYKGVLGFECSNCHHTEQISVSFNYCPNRGRKVEKKDEQDHTT